jgi:hypothetical protein
MTTFQYIFIKIFVLYPDSQGPGPFFQRYFQTKHEILPFLLSLYLITIDGQVRLVHSQADNFRLFLCSTDGQTTNFNLHDEQTVNGLRKIAWASIFRLKRQHRYTHTQTPLHTHECTHERTNPHTNAHRKQN